MDERHTSDAPQNHDSANGLYEQNCKWAATDQGLDPISARLTAEGITHAVEQTGGHVMLIRIPLQEPAWIGINAGEMRSGRWHVVFYADDEGAEGLDITDRGPIDWTNDDYRYEWDPDGAVAAIQPYLNEPRNVRRAIQAALERLHRSSPGSEVSREI